MVAHKVPVGRLVTGSGIHVALVQRGEHLVHADEAVHVLYLLHAVHLMVQQQLLRSGAVLHGDPLSVQIAEPVNAAVAAYHHHLTAIHIRPCPLVAILASCHGKAAPETVHRALLQQDVLELPCDLLKFRLVSHAAAGFRGDLHIDAGKGAALVQIEVRLIVIAADDQLRQRLLLLLPSTAAQHQRAQHQQRRQPFPYMRHWLSSPV